MLQPTQPHIREFAPRATAWRHFAWDNGRFDTAQRPLTPVAEGRMQTPHYLFLLTIRGGAERLEVTTAGGHRYDGPDRAGAVSFLPAHCERRLRLINVRSHWASLSLAANAFTQIADDEHPPLDLPAFSNVTDGFLSSVVREAERLHAEDGALDPTYCDAMAHAVAHYMARRFVPPVVVPTPARGWNLPAWKMRRLEEYIDAHLAEPIRIATLARLADVSEGHLHRAFRVTTGRTPLQFLNEKRVRRAIETLVAEPAISVAALALRVGFQSPSHFARTFRRCAGCNPSDFSLR